MTFTRGSPRSAMAATINVLVRVGFWTLIALRIGTPEHYG
jgi:hypothetical protein